MYPEVELNCDGSCLKFFKTLPACTMNGFPIWPDTYEQRNRKERSFGSARSVFCCHVDSSNRPFHLHDPLTLTLLTWRTWWAPTNASKWRMGFNSVFKGLNKRVYPYCPITFLDPTVTEWLSIELRIVPCLTYSTDFSSRSTCRLVDFMKRYFRSSLIRVPATDVVMHNISTFRSTKDPIYDGGKNFGNCR